MEETLEIENIINEEQILKTSKEYQREYYLKNIKKFKEKRQQHRTDNPEYFKTYYEANKNQMKHGEN